MRDRKEAVQAFVGLVIASVFLHFFDPVIASAFGQALANPQFAASPAGGIWKVMEVLSDFDAEILPVWIGYFLWLFERI